MGMVDCIPETRFPGARVVDGQVAAHVEVDIQNTGGSRGGGVIQVAVSRVDAGEAGQVAGVEIGTGRIQRHRRAAQVGLLDCTGRGVLNNLPGGRHGVGYHPADERAHVERAVGGQRGACREEGNICRQVHGMAGGNGDLIAVGRHAVVPGCGRTPGPGGHTDRHFCRYLQDEQEGKQQCGEKKTDARVRLDKREGYVSVVKGTLAPIHARSVLLDKLWCKKGRKPGRNGPQHGIKQNDKVPSGLSLEEWREAKKKRQETRLPQGGQT